MRRFMQSVSSTSARQETSESQSSKSSRNSLKSRSCMAYQRSNRSICLSCSFTEIGWIVALCSLSAAIFSLFTAIRSASFSRSDFGAIVINLVDQSGTGCKKLSQVTWVSEKGCFQEVLERMLREQTTGELGFGFAASIEGDYPFDLGEGWQLEPQARLADRQFR